MASQADAHGQAQGHGHAHEVHHPYHLVDPSPWPAAGSIAALTLVVGGLMYMHEIAGGPWVMLAAVAILAFTLVCWWRDVIREGMTGHHTEVVSKGLRIGMALFITSEVLFFFAFFWAYFWGALIHPVDVPDYSWLPAGAHPVPTWDIPFLNTLILLLSGCTVTWAHHALQHGDQKNTVRGLAVTVLLGLLFTAVQAYEYSHAAFGFREGIYPSTFFMATGFHGLHVIIGTCFLIVCLFRAMKGHFKPDHHFGFEAAAWYWHFVDVVWLFLFACVYWWGFGVAGA
jgi:cytochrome c oxidase subunit 3